MGIIKQTIDEVFTSPIVVSFWETYKRFLRFEMVFGILDSVAPSFFKYILLGFAGFLNLLVIILLHLLSIFVCLLLVLYLIPLLVYNVLSLYWD